MFLDFYFSVICYLYRPLFFFLEYIFTLPETHFSLLINRKSETRKRRSLLLLDLRLNISSHSTPFSLSLWWIFCWIRCQLGMIHLAPAAGSIPDDPEDRRETWFPPQIGEKKIREMRMRKKNRENSLVHLLSAIDRELPWLRPLQGHRRVTLSSHTMLWDIYFFLVRYYFMASGFLGVSQKQ